jgi:hypothetical protein
METDLVLDLASGAAAVAVLVALYVVVRRPPAIDASVDAAELVVRFRGWDVVWTLRGQVRIPLGSIESVTVHRAESLWSGWWHRRLGTVIPGTIKAGWSAGPELASCGTSARVRRSSTCAWPSRHACDGWSCKCPTPSPSPTA